MGACAVKENLLAERVHFAFGWMSLLGCDGRALRFGCQPGHQCFDFSAQISPQGVRLRSDRRRDRVPESWSYNAQAVPRYP